MTRRDGHGPSAVIHMIRQYPRVFFGDRAAHEIRVLDTRVFRMASNRSRRVKVGDGLRPRTLRLVKP